MTLSELTRREFLARATAGVALAAASAPRVHGAETTATGESAKSADTASEKKLGWAIAGIGNFARGPILKNIGKCQHSQVRGFVTRDPQGKGQKFAEEYGVDPAAVVALEDMQKLASRDDIDVVYVITPNALHKPYVLAALKAGKHVFCEKPFAPSEADCREMIDAAKAAGKLIGLGYRMRFDGANIRAIEMIANGDLGKTKFITGEFGFNLNTRNPAGEWRADLERSGGGSLADIGVYGVNAARFLTGEEPVEVSGHIYSTPGDPRFAEVEETCMFRFRFPSGILFQGTSSYGITGSSRLRAVGDKSWLDLEPAIAYEGAQMTVPQKGGAQKVPFEPTNQFALEMDDFSQAIKEGRPARSTGEDGLRDVRLIEAIYKSAREGGKVQNLAG